MLKIIIGITVALLVVGGGSYYLFSEAPQKETPTVSYEVNLRVVSEGVFIVTGGQKIHVLRPTKVAPGTTIITDQTGEAVLEFPSGSVARLDVGTTIVLEAEFFDEKSGIAQTSLSLSLGRVWSRVAKLITPASHWEVKTSNVVAAVRGTAFYVGFTKENESRVLVNKNEVSVRAIDPRTKAVLAETVMPEGKFVELDADEQFLPTAAIAVVEPPKEFAEDPWIKKNEKEDKKIEADIEKRERELEERAKVFQEAIEKEGRQLEEYIEEKKSGIENLQEDKSFFERIFGATVKPIEETRELEDATPLAEEKKEVEAAPATRDTTSSNELTKPANTITPEVQRVTSGVRRPVSLEIVALPKLPAYFEGAKVQYRAFLSYSDGTRADVSDKVRWSLAGPVGSITTGGVFVAKITDEFTAEFGHAEGSVNAKVEVEGVTLAAEEKIQVFPVADTNLDETRG